MVADRLLARSGYESQFADVPYDPDRPDNLFSAVSGDPGAHGEFDDQSLASSVQLELTKNRRLVGLAVLTLVAAVAGVLRD